jgi:hypothetical protein
MDTRNGVSARLLGAVAIRPAGPGLVLVAGLLAIAITGWPATSVPWLWPVCTVLVVMAVVINTARQDVSRRAQTRRHQQRLATANALLNDRPPPIEPDDEIIGSIRELGGQVERFGHKLDDLLSEAHAEKSKHSAFPRAAGTNGQEKA